MQWKAVLFFFGLAAVSLEASSVYSFSAAPTAHDSNLSLGFEFSTNTAITISSLGYFDATGGGFASAHQVGIYDATGHLLVSTTLDTGTADPLTGDFRFKSIAPFTLAAGQTYTLAATTGGTADAWAYGDAGSTLANFTVDPRISIAQDAARYDYENDDVLHDPCNHYLYTLYAGPSFEIASDPSPAPEPASIGLLGGGLLGLIGMLRRRRDRK